MASIMGPDARSSGSSKKRHSSAGSASVILSDELLQGGPDKWHNFLGYVEILHGDKWV